MTKYSVVVDMECEADTDGFIEQLIEKLYLINQKQWYSIRSVMITRIGEAKFGTMNPETMMWSGKDES